MASGVYHRCLRVSAVLTMLMLLFDGGFVLPLTKQLSDNTIRFLANSSSVSMSVPENELNVITAGLEERARDLAAREAALAEREIDARNFGSSAETDWSTYILSMILFILTTLIVLNYAFDYSRERRNRYAEQVA